MSVKVERVHDLERQLSDAQQRTVKQAEDIARLEDSGRDINSQVQHGQGADGEHEGEREYQSGIR